MRVCWRYQAWKETAEVESISYFSPILPRRCFVYVFAIISEEIAENTPTHTRGSARFPAFYYQFSLYSLSFPFQSSSPFFLFSRPFHWKNKYKQLTHTREQTHNHKHTQNVSFLIPSKHNCTCICERGKAFAKMGKLLWRQQQQNGERESTRKAEVSAPESPFCVFLSCCLLVLLKMRTCDESCEKWITWDPVRNLSRKCSLKKLPSFETGSMWVCLWVGVIILRDIMRHFSKGFVSMLGWIGYANHAI